MGRDIITNKWILGAVLLLIIVAGGSYFYYAYTTAQHKKAAAELDEFVRQWEKDRQAQQKSSTETQETLTGTPAESDTPQNAEKHVTNATVTKETAATPGQTGAAAENTETAEVRMSPHGLGPYPEVPEDYRAQFGPLPWEQVDLFGAPTPGREVELITRIMLKLWKEGRTDVRSGWFENGKVYVNYANHAYVTWTDVKNADGTTSRALTSWSSSENVGMTSERMHNGYIPPGFRITDLDEVEDPGIEPYSFLGLDK